MRSYSSRVGGFIRRGREIALSAFSYTRSKGSRNAQQEGQSRQESN